MNIDPKVVSDALEAAARLHEAHPEWREREPLNITPSEQGVELLSFWGDDLTVVNNARVSFDKESEWFVEKDGEGWSERLKSADQRLIGYLARGCTTEQWDEILRKVVIADELDEVVETLNYVRHMPDHWAPFANGCGARFRFKTPIPMMRQLFKTKVGTVESEVSRRYVDSEPKVFYPQWRERVANVKQGSGEDITGPAYDDLNEIYHYSVIRALEAYDLLLDNGVCPEQARFVLPQGCFTEAIISNSLYGWARFYNQRKDRSHAQGEIADIADMIGSNMSQLFPVSWEALTK